MNIELGNVIPIQRDTRDTSDYIGEDGLIYCGKCHTPKQCRLTYEGVEQIRPVMCQCRKERLEAEKERQENEAIERRLEKVKQLSMIDSRFRSHSFDSWEHTPDNEKPLRVCMRYVDHFAEMLEDGQGLLLYGPVGTGKTYAAACIANELIDRRHIVVMTSFVRLLNAFDGKAQDDIEKRMNDADLLIIDDLGAERGTDYALERVYSFIDSRYRSGKPLMLTTNLTIGYMQTASDIRYTRIYDRIFEMCYPVRFEGQSFRKTQAAERTERMKRLLEGED